MFFFYYIFIFFVYFFFILTICLQTKTIGAASTRYQIYWRKNYHFHQSVLSRHVKSPIFIPVVELDKNASKQKTN